MKKNPSIPFLSLLLLITGYSCNTVYQSQALQYKSYQVKDSLSGNAESISFLKPYTERIKATMNEVVGFADIDLEKKQPECTLGNFLADAFLTMAQEKYNTKADISIMNFGGMRLTQLPRGEVTNGKIFELMPFDNLLILQEVKGETLQQFLNLVAAKGGWPVAGMTMQIKDKKAINVTIGGKPLDPTATYKIVNSDFIANGGDNADMLRAIPQITNGYLMRDAIFDYIKKLRGEGKNITAKLENRVTNAQ
jgi:2',3'-cyclic-nucleotide 2'-phosphodiesterase (5'-nucleotidase family)